VTATNGVAVAIFRTANRCDEVVALNAGTGVRAWTRNVNFAADARLTSTDSIVLAVSRGGLATIDPTGDTLRWRYTAPSGCRILDAAAGRSGIALLQRCDSSAPVQLRLLDGFGGSPHWSRDLAGSASSTVRLLGADQLVGVTVGDSARFLAGPDGSAQGSLQLPAGAAETAAQTSAGSTVFLWAAGTLTAFDDTNADVRWSTPALGLPADAPAAAATPKTAVLVPQGDGFVRRDATTGVESGRSTVAGLPGPGVAAATGTTVIYRLGDRVLGYR
jgi:outer membrane protein assembly factor BamB